MKRFSILILIVAGILSLGAGWIPTTDTVTASWTTIYEHDVTRDKHITFKIKNTGVANPFTDCRVQSWIGPGTTDTTATGVLSLSANAGNNETVTLGTKVYTFQTVLSPVDGDGNVLIGANASESLDNLIEAIVLGANPGVKYGSGTTLHSVVTAAAGAGDTMDVTAKDAGGAGNIASTETLANGEFTNGDLLTGGLDAWASFLDAGIACKTLTPGVAIALDVVGHAHEKLRVQVKSASGTTSYCRAWAK